jgi:hypothetical protein
MRPTLHIDVTILAPGRRMPTADVRLIAAVAVAGSLTALVVGPSFWVATAGAVALLVLASRRGAGPGTPDGPQLWTLPLPLQRAVRTTLADLPEGDAKRLLTEIARHASSLFSRPEALLETGGGADTRANISDLVEASCEVAMELSRLDRAFPREAPVAGDVTLTAQVLASRRLFAGRLEDAACALAESYAAGVGHGTRASDRVAEMVKEIRADAAATSDAHSELQRLLDRGLGH